MIDVTTFLAHHGVKGMKWGVRKDRKQIKGNLLASAKVMEGRQATRNMGATLTETEYKNLSDKDVVVGKNATLRRVTRNVYGDTLQKNTYVSTNDADAKVYNGIMTAQYSGLKKKYKGEYYESTYEATTQLKSPSEKKRVDGYIKLLDTRAVHTTDGRVLTGKEYLAETGMAKEVATLSTRELALTHYGHLTIRQGYQGEPLSTAYFKSMTDKGYTALVDDNDAGMLSRTPIVVLDAYKNLRRTEVRQLSDEDIHTAQATLELPASKYDRR